MPERSTLFGIALVAAIVLSVCLHEAGHALVAHWRGDSGPKERGRVTINPLKHIHPVLTIALPAFLWFGLPWLTRTIPFLPEAPRLLFGGARPVMVDRTRFRHPHRDMMFVALAGPAVNVLIAFAALFAYDLFLVEGDFARSAFGMELLIGIVKWNLFLAAFNMIPVPPLDGSRVLAWLTPPPARPLVDALDRIGLVLVLVLAFFLMSRPDLLLEMEYVLADVYGAMAKVVRGTYDLVGLR